jgi:hypothetical protein
MTTAGHRPQVTSRRTTLKLSWCSCPPPNTSTARDQSPSGGVLLEEGRREDEVGERERDREKDEWGWHVGPHGPHYFLIILCLDDMWVP